MKPAFTPYQIFVVALLSFLQFTVVLDFMILAPLGPFVLRDLHITAAQFGFLVSAYAFSAGISGLLAAGFADKFDRKYLLLFFYTVLCSELFCAGLPAPITSSSERASSRAFLAAWSAPSDSPLSRIFSPWKFAAA